MKNIKNLLLGGLIALALVGCGGSSGGVSNTSKKISGVALKEDGTVFPKDSKVYAVDANGNTAEGSVTDDNGKYEVTLTGVASTGKKSKLLDGNSVLRVEDPTEFYQMNLVIAEDQTNVNFNVVTSAASLVIIGNSELDLDDLFTEVKAANVAGKKGKGVIPQTSAILFALAKVQVLTKEVFKNVATSTAGTLFGFDSAGNPAVEVDKLLTGSSTEKEVTLLQAAAKFNGDILTDTFEASKSGEGLNLLNEAEFFEDLGVILAEAEGAASSNAFSSFLSDVVKSDELKDALNELAEALNEFVAAYEADPDTPFAVDVGEIATNAKSVTVTAARNGDTITLSVSGAENNDQTDVAVAVISGDAVEAVISVHLTSDASGALEVGDAEIIVTTGSVSVTVKNSNALTGNTINLATALEEASAALASTEVAGKIPATTVGLTLNVSASPVTRGSDIVATFISVNGVTTNAAFGVVFE